MSMKGPQNSFLSSPKKVNIRQTFTLTWENVLAYVRPFDMGLFQGTILVPQKMYRTFLTCTILTPLMIAGGI